MKTNIDLGLEPAAEISEIESPVEQESAPERDTTEMKPEKSLSMREMLSSKMKEDAPAKGETPAVTKDAKTPAKAEGNEPILAPADMTKEEKAAFEANPTLQKYLSRRAYEMRSDYTKKTTELSAKEREASDILNVTNQVRDTYAKQGISVPDLVRRSIAWDQAFKQDRLGAAREYLESYGIHPSELAEAQGEVQNTQQNQQYLTPVQARELAQQEISRVMGEQQEIALAQRNATDVKSFIDSKPLFKDPGTASQIEAAMVPVVRGLKHEYPSSSHAEILEKAYNYVVQGDPTFSALVSKLNAKSEAERKNAEAQKAKASSRSISGSPGSGTPRIAASNLRENLRLRFNGA